MDWLRISLLALGVALLLGIWTWHRLRVQRRQRALREDADDWAEDDIVHIRAHRDDDDPVLTPVRGERLAGERLAKDVPAPASVAAAADDGPDPAETPEPAVIPGANPSAPAARVAASGAGFSATLEDDVSAPRIVGRNPNPFRDRREKILLLHVVAPGNRPFTGVALGAALRRAGLQLGEMSIYHAPAAVEGIEPLFSAANMVAPGTLSETDLADLMTPGITLFMQLHQSETPQEAFDAMLAAAHALARDLGGSILDANRSTATNQTLAHLREEMHQWLLRQRPDLLRRRSVP